MGDPLLKRLAFAGECFGIPSVGDKYRDGCDAAPDQAIEHRYVEYGSCGQQRFSFAVRKIPGERHARRRAAWGKAKNAQLGSHRWCLSPQVSNAASLPQRKVDENITALFRG